MATITQDSVYAAAEALEARGARVSVRTIRDHLGGGSPNQITPLLASWRAKRPQVAQADIQLDPEMEASFSALRKTIVKQVEVAAGDAARRADERATEAEDTLQLCQQENAELAEQLAAATTALDDVRAQREQQAGTIAELREDLTRTRKEALEEIEAADAKAERERESAEMARTALAKAELRLEALPRLEAEIERLRVALETAQAGRQAAEQQAAVLAAQEAAAIARVEDLTGRLAAQETAASARVAELASRLEIAEKRAQEAAQEAKAQAAAAGEASRAGLAASTQLEAAQRELAGLREALAEAKTELKEARAELKNGKKEK